jgi:hypothetical protein
MNNALSKTVICLALILFGVIAVLAAPTTGDRLLCALVPLAGAAFVALGIRQDRADKRAYRGSEEKEAK